MIDDISNQEVTKLFVSEMSAPEGCACGCSCWCACPCAWPFNYIWLDDYGWSRSDSLLYSTYFSAVQ